MKKYFLFVLGLLLLCLSFNSSVMAETELKLPILFTDNMVLQRNMPIPVWGSANPGETINVALDNDHQTAITDEKGQWLVKMKSMKAGGPYELTISGSKQTIKLQNILIGEVWICSGQSNMEFRMGESQNADQEAAAAGYPDIRFFTMEKKVNDSLFIPSPSPSRWEICSPKTAGGFSAVGYFFGRDLYQELKVPIGLINNAWGGTPAEAWTKMSVLEANPNYAPILERWRTQVADYKKAAEEYQQKVKERALAVKKAKAEGKPMPDPLPGLPVPPERDALQPAGLYNGLIAPLLPFAIRGVIWYQGEANADRAYQYRTLFPDLIHCWRNSWGQGDFPFLYVQLANYTAVQPEPIEDAWAELREAQLMTLKVPNTAMAVAIDVGDANTIHPTNKQEVGRRLYLAALATVYGKKVPYSGPLYKSMKVEGNKIRIFFSHTDQGLKAQNDRPLQGFAIAGTDHKFYWAEARIEKNSVLISCEKVPSPVAVRYAWAINPECNLYNGAGLPASPFRTDDWPGLTYGKN